MFKGDRRYTERCDERNSSPDTSADELEVPKHVQRTRHAWLTEYEDELEEMYQAFLANGRLVIGRSFHQLGSFEHFAKFVFKYMQPGAT